MEISASDLENILQHQQAQFESLLKKLHLSTPPATKPQSLPKFDSFVKSKEKFDQYVERLQQHFMLHNAKDCDMKKACFLASIGPEPYQLLKNIFSGEDLASKTYDQLVNKLSTHYKEIVNKHAARHEFSQSTLKPGQSYVD